ncbi:hypothetical protein ES703_21652 [subsurface metagenome]|nr:hypothetical protein [bacterium]
MVKKELKLVTSRWTRFEFNPFDELPPKELKLAEGNYAIFVDGELNYIGKSVNIYTRIGDHKLAVGFSSRSRMEIAVRIDPGEERHEIEEKFIARLQPRANFRVPIHGRGRGGGRFSHIGHQEPKGCHQPWLYEALTASHLKKKEETCKKSRI